MRIALIHTALAGPSGGEKQVLQLAINLKKLGHKVELFTNRAEKECFPELQKQVKINTLKTSIERLRKLKSEKKGLFSKFLELFGEWSNLLVMWKIGRSLENKFDLINCHNFPSEWAAYFAKKRLKVPVVWMCNEPPFFFFNNQSTLKRILNLPLYFFFDKLAIKKIDNIVVLDNLNKERVKKIYNRDAEVIRSGLDINKFKTTKLDSEKIRKRYNINKSFMLLSVTGFLDFKRPQDSINACNLLIKKGLDVKLVILGIGPLIKKCQKLTKYLDIEDKVIFAGKGVSSEIPIYYLACDALLFPSEQTWGLVVVEAMASKKPTVVSDKSGVSEIIDNGKNGFVFESRNTEEIASLVEKLMKDKKLYRRIADSGYKYVTRNISWQKYAKNMESVFKQVLKNLS